MEMIRSFNMATMPQRKETAIKSIESIYDQADIIRLYLNNFDEIPKEYVDSKIEIVSGSDDLKSSGKLYWALNPNEYYFCVDDDIFYPSDYSEYMVNKLKEYNNDVIVSMHGRVMKKGKINNYFRDRTEYYHFLKGVDVDKKVDIIGNGVSCWNTNNIKIDYKKFKYLFMDDIFVSIESKNNNKDRVVISHKEGYLKDLGADGFTLYDKHINDHKYQTEIVNSTQW